MPFSRPDAAPFRHLIGIAPWRTKNHAAAHSGERFDPARLASTFLTPGFVTTASHSRPAFGGAVPARRQASCMVTTSYNMALHWNAENIIAQINFANFGAIYIIDINYSHVITPIFL
jgi:hypothetical protein